MIWTNRGARVLKALKKMTQAYQDEILRRSGFWVGWGPHVSVTTDVHQTVRAHINGLQSGRTEGSA